MAYSGYVVRRVQRVIEIEERVFQAPIHEYKPLRHAVVSRSKTNLDDAYVIGLFPSQWAALDYIELNDKVHGEPQTRVWEYMEVV